MMSQFLQVNLCDMISQLGEERTKNILSSFSCPLNPDVEEFLKFKAIEFSKRDLARVHLVFWQSEEEKELVGYYTLSIKTFEIAKGAVSKTELKKVSQHGTYDNYKKLYIIPAALIGQLGKNFTLGNDTLISGQELLQMAINKVRFLRKEIGFKYAYLECEDKEKLINFYGDNGFKQFGKRTLDNDETNLDGDYLIQFMRYMKDE